MLTKLHRLLYEEAAFDAFRASVVRYAVALIGLAIASPPAWLAEWIGSHPGIGGLIGITSLLIAAGNKTASAADPPAA